LAYRIAYLVAAQAVAPNSIVAFTFTDKAADTIKRRVADALQASGLDPATLGAMYIGTIHAFCHTVLGQIDAQYRQFDVLDENRILLFLMSRYPEIGLQNLRKERGARYFETIKEVARAWQVLNDELLNLADVESQDAQLGAVLRGVEDRMRAAQFIDFSLMIRRTVEALADGRVARSETICGLRHLLVDEYQDVNPAQEALIRGLHYRGASLFVVGDDDQAIYAWRGADISNILTFQRRYGAARHDLTHNYRSTEAIVAAADAFAAAELGAARLAKHPTATNPQGPRDFQRVWFATRPDEANWVAERVNALVGTAYIERDGTVRGLTPADVAILMRSTRSNEQSGQPRHAAFTQSLHNRGIPYSLEAGGGPFERPQVRALVASFALLRGGSPAREDAEVVYDTIIAPAFPSPDFDRYAQVLSQWGREILAPSTNTRRRVFPQELVHELLQSFGIQTAGFSDVVMRDLALFSRIMQDVEAVYLSIDSAQRFGDILNFLENMAESGYDTSTDDLVVRPDAVTVTTVHKAKGLEFPVVFVVDAEQGRFPVDRTRYEGWLPLPVVRQAIARGAYETTAAGEARLFYTAATRAERYLYVSGAELLPSGRKRRKLSQFALRLTHPEIDTTGKLPSGLRSAIQRRRIEDSELPTSFSEIRYYLMCPKNYQFRKRYGFSPPIPELFGFGQTVHTSIGKLHQTHSEFAPTREQAEQIAKEVFHLKHVAPSRDPVNRPGPYENARARAAEIVGTYAESFGKDFAHERQVEARFEVPLDRTVISGSIDLLIRENEAGEVVDAKVIDFKSIQGGTEPESSQDLDWTELALQVQLYALGARQVLGENTRTGAVHFLKDNLRVDVPIDDDALRAAVQNVEWSVGRIIAGDFPMRPHHAKCETCDFRMLCAQTRQEFSAELVPPPIHVPLGEEMARAFSEVE